MDGSQFTPHTDPPPHSGPITLLQPSCSLHVALSGCACRYLYGGGVQACRPGATQAGQPIRKIDMGFTAVKQADFHAYLRGISSRYTPATYSLLSHNCNNFSHEVVRFLTGTDMPAYITGLPEEALNSPMGAMLRPVIMNMEQQIKQSGGMSAIPWSVELLDLPSSCSAPDRMHTPTATEQQQTSAAANLSHQHNISAPATTILSPTASSTPHHPHAALQLQVVSAGNKPLLSTDKKEKSFWALVKANDKKVKEELRLKDDERKTFETLVDELGKDTPTLTAEQEASAERLFGRLLREWPAETVFPVLGLLRVFVLRPSVAARYEDSVDGTVKALLTFVPSDVSASSPPMAAQAMALCVVANLFARPSLASKLTTQPSLLLACRSLLSSPHQSVRVMAATVLYNLALTLPRSDDDDTIELCTHLLEHVKTEADAETEYRSLLSLGHLLYGNSALAGLAGSLEWDGKEVAGRFVTDHRIGKVVTDIDRMVQYEQQQMAAE